MSILSRGRGTHRALALPEARHEITRLTALNETLTCAETQARVELADADAALKVMTALAKKHGNTVIRQAADLARLRQAVINARPRIIVADPPLVPPYAPMCLPYPVPVHSHNTSGDDTVQMPLLDLPDPGPLLVGWTALATANA